MQRANNEGLFVLLSVCVQCVRDPGIKQKGLNLTQLSQRHTMCPFLFIAVCLLPPVFLLARHAASESSYLSRFCFFTQGRAAS